MTISPRQIVRFSGLAACSLALLACAEPGDEQTVLTPYDAGGDAELDTDVDDNGDVSGDPDDAVGDNGGDDAGESGDATGEEDASDDNGEFCQPVGDGTIRRSEFPVEIDAAVPYEFALDVEVDITGEEIDGTTVWDFEEVDGDDFVEELEIHDPDEFWFGDEFPEATYAARLSAAEDELGIYQVTDDALLLLGLATPHGPESDDDHTHIEYDPEIDVLSFPFEVGDTWETEVEASGEYAEVSSYSGHDETYRVEVDDAGEVITPYATFDVLRVYTVREHPTSDILDPCWYNIYLSCDVETRVVSYVAECFGTVARVISHEDEGDEEFNDAAEVMRLTQ